uniref:M1 killer toxin n=1 Tax=Saccharomyces cerevisiae TaxID=4932 RepID=A0A076FLW9_YEASX|nr:M1 killer toxin [Saccharomyces cerevisiae]
MTKPTQVLVRSVSILFFITLLHLVVALNDVAGPAETAPVSLLPREAPWYDKIWEVKDWLLQRATDGNWGKSITWGSFVASDAGVVIFGINVCKNCVGERKDDSSTDCGKQTLALLVSIFVAVTSGHHLIWGGNRPVSQSDPNGATVARRDISTVADGDIPLDFSALNDILNEHGISILPANASQYVKRSDTAEHTTSFVVTNNYTSLHTDLIHHGNGTYTTFTTPHIPAVAKRYVYPMCEHGIKASYCMAFNDAMVSANGNLYGLAEKLFSEDEGQWETNYYKLYWSTGQWIMSMKFIEESIDNANNDFEGCDTGH